MAGSRPRARLYTTGLNTFEQAAFWSFTSPFVSGPDGPLSIEYERHEPEKTLLHQVAGSRSSPSSRERGAMLRLWPASSSARSVPTWNAEFSLTVFCACTATPAVVTDW